MSQASFYRSPDDLLHELGITEPQDILIEAIAQHCGATILYEPLSGCEARIIGYGDQAIITVNKLSKPNRQRFSGGHELGHWLYDRGQIAFACTEKMFTTEWSKNNPERRANRYAADLLLPFSIFRRYVRNRKMTFETVRDLANIFQTSLTATAIRLVELGSAPAILVCSNAKTRCWFVLGSKTYVSPLLKPRLLLSPKTMAYKLLHSHVKEPGPCEVDADAWFSQSRMHQCMIHEDSVRVKKDHLVLSLLSWPDERQIFDLDLETG